MSSLTDSDRRKVVQRLAAFETPTEVVEWAYEELSKDLSVQQVCYYDPTRSGETSQKWRKLFKEARREFLDDLDTIPLSHRAVRLRELTDLYEKAKEAGEVEKAARMLKQAAKEVGEKFTNVERKEHSGPEGTPVQVIFDDDVPKPDDNTPDE